MNAKSRAPRSHCCTRVTAVPRPTLLSLLTVLAVFFGLTPTAAADVEEPTVTIRSVSPAVLVDEDEVTVSVHLARLEPEDVEAVKLEAYIRADPFFTFGSLEQFLDTGLDDGWAAGEMTLTADQARDAQTPTGVTVPLTLQVEQMPLWNTAAWGPYGLTLRVGGLKYDAATPYGPKAQTLFVWHPEGSAGQAHVNVLLREVTQQEDPEQWGSLVRPGTTLVAAPSDLPGLAANPKARLAEVFLVPQEDASLGLLAATGQQELFALAQENRATLTSGEEQAASQRSFKLVTAGVLADENQWGAALLAGSQGQPIILTGDAAQIEDTADAVAGSKFFADATTPDATPQQKRTVLADWPELATLLARPPGTPAEEFQTAQQIRALTALAATQDQSDQTVAGQHYLRVSTTADYTAPGEARMDALFESPWVQPATLQEIIRGPANPSPRAPVPTQNSEATEKAARTLRPLNNEVEHARAVAAATDDPAAMMAEVAQAALPATKVDLTNQQRKKRVKKARADVAQAVNLVEIAPSSTVNMMNYHADLPLMLHNRGDSPMDVLVHLQPADTRLQVKEPVEARIPAKGNVNVDIPMVAVGGGDVNVTAQATTLDGTVLDTSEQIKVRLRAGLEDSATVVVALIVGALFILGLVRSGKRNKTKQKETLSSVDK